MGEDYIVAPWTQEQVDELNAYQQCGFTHPYTCGNNRSDENHKNYQALVDGDWGQLVATKDGWICPVCGNKQDWALKASAELDLTSLKQLWSMH